MEPLGKHIETWTAQDFYCLDLALQPSGEAHILSKS